MGAGAGLCVWMLVRACARMRCVGTYACMQALIMHWFYQAYGVKMQGVISDPTNPKCMKHITAHPTLSSGLPAEPEPTRLIRNWSTDGLIIVSAFST